MALDRRAAPISLGAIGGGLMLKPVLASASPQRTAILNQLGIAHVVVPAAVNERMDGDPRKLAEQNARAKAQAVAPQHRATAVIGCDTVVIAPDGELLGKPLDVDGARQMLAALAGATHTVVSGLAIAGPGQNVRSGVAETSVTFRALSAGEIDRHLAFGEWQGRAGGYAIQARGAGLVSAISGDYFNVVGLPVSLLFELLPDVFDRGGKRSATP